MSGKPGRPNKLTPARLERILYAVRLGAARHTQAKVGGISESCLQSWIAKGKAAKSGEYRDFLDRLDEAEAEGELTMLGRIDEASLNDWRAAAWRLERTDPERFGKQDRIDLTTKGQSLLGAIIAAESAADEDEDAGT